VRTVARWLWHPLVAWSLYAVAMWAWHLPAFYASALRDPFVHDLQHLSFFASGCIFWRVLLDPRSRQRTVGLLAVVYLFTTTLHATLLGVLMTLAPTPWYPDYVGRTTLWQLTAMEDQQLAGLIMWMPACAAYLLIAVVAVAEVLGQMEHAPQDAPRRTGRSRTPLKPLASTGATGGVH